MFKENYETRYYLQPDYKPPEKYFETEQYDYKDQEDKRIKDLISLRIRRNELLSYQRYNGDNEYENAKAKLLYDYLVTKRLFIVPQKSVYCTKDCNTVYKSYKDSCNYISDYLPKNNSINKMEENVKVYLDSNPDNKNEFIANLQNCSEGRNYNQDCCYAYNHETQFIKFVRSKYDTVPLFFEEKELYNLSRSFMEQFMKDDKSHEVVNRIYGDIFTKASLRIDLENKLRDCNTIKEKYKKNQKEYEQYKSKIKKMYKKYVLSEDDTDNILIKAVIAKDLNEVRRILKLARSKILLNGANMYGQTPLHHAKLIKDEEIIKELENAGAIELEDEYGYTPTELYNLF